MYTLGQARHEEPTTQSSLKELTLGKEGDEFNPPKPNLSIKQHETHRRSYNRALKGAGGGGGVGTGRGEMREGFLEEEGSESNLEGWGERM